jgi:hypothetical protein
VPTSDFDNLDHFPAAPLCDLLSCRIGRLGRLHHPLARHGAGLGPRVSLGHDQRSTAMSNKSNATIATMGIDIGKNSFHVVGLDQRGAIVLRQKWSRGQIEARLANIPPCLIGMEACVGAHPLSRKLQSFGHDAWLMPAKYVRPYAKGQKNDFRDGETIAEAAWKLMRTHAR